MNKLILAVLASLVAANVALAQTAAPAAADKKPAAEKKAEAKKAPSEKQLKQQETMKSCNKEAGEKKLKGDERKKFMSGCLKAGAPAAANPPKPKPHRSACKTGHSCSCCHTCEAGREEIG